jgi:hypothetical protein
MRTFTRWRGRVGAMVLVAAVTLAACASDEPAETATEVDDDQATDAPAADEDEPTATDEDEGEPSTTEEEDEPSPTDAQEDDTTGPPAQPRTIEVGETQRYGGYLDLTVERVVAYEYHTEVEVRAVNTSGDSRVGIVYDHVSYYPELFDDRDRRFVYEHPAGTDTISLGAGQILEMTMAFRGAVQPDAETITLRVQVDESLPPRERFEFVVPVGDDR